MANNPYVNKVQLADGTSIIDISSTTATADKIIEGYGAFGADGAWMSGTAHEGADLPIWQGDDDYVYLSDTANAPVEIYVDEDGYIVLDLPPAVINLQTKTKSYTPTETAQSETVTPDNGYDGLGQVDISVGAISPSYVGSGVTRRSASDMTASGATVTAPAGYYASASSKEVANGTAGTPTATKGTVSNHSVSVTPSVTNTAGYIEGGTKTGTAVSVSASELVSGTLTVESSGTKDVTNYASASIPAGSATPSATKGTVSNHSVSVTPSVTSSAGWINTGSSTGTPVTVSASELDSGTKSITENGTGIDVVGYSQVDVNVSSGPKYYATITSTGISNMVFVRYPDQTGTKYYTSGNTFEIEAGNIIYLSARGSTAANITVNDTIVASSTTTATYSYTVPSRTSVTIALTYGDVSSIVLTEMPDEVPLGIVNGSFTTISSLSSESSVTIDYQGSGYPIGAIIYANYGWDSTASLYDIGYISFHKKTTNAPAYTDGSNTDNLTDFTYMYKYSSSVITTTGGSSAITFVGSSYVPAYGINSIKFIGDGTTMWYKTGGNTNSTHGLAVETTYNYIIIYSE